MNSDVKQHLPPIWKKTAGKSRPALFAELAVIEPQLKGLLDKAQKWQRNSRCSHRVCANERWYGYSRWKGRGLKDKLCRLVGYEAQNPRLRTEDAYDVAYDHIYAALPDCRNCGELSLQALLSL